MAGLRHDAKQCREHVTSEQIRVTLGIETEKEKEKHMEKQKKKEKEQAKEQAKGTPLF